MSLVVGETFGAYRITEQLGRGGMATVYKGYQTSLARFVAIKVLPAFFAEEEGFRERFRREAIAVAQLRHPNILAVFDYGEEEGVAYIVNEFVDGGTLADQLGNPLPVDYTVRMLAPIASALDYAHSRGVVHRDVKPSNILLARDGTPILGDFGLARMMGSLPRLSRTGTAMGTPEYMAPEQAEGDEAGPPADLYALAVVAYEMVTGRVPFSAATPLAVLLAHVSKPLPLPRAVNPELKPEVEAVLLKGLAKAPEDRYKTVSEFIRALAEAGAAPIAAPPQARTDILPGERPAPIKEVATTMEPAAPAPVVVPKGSLVATEPVVAAGLTVPEPTPPSLPIGPTPAPAEAQPAQGREPSAVASKRPTILAVLGLIGVFVVGALIVIPRLPPSVTMPVGEQRGSGSTTTSGVTVESTSAESESPPVEALVPVATATPTADERWDEMARQLDALWGQDWEGAIDSLEQFLEDDPDYALAKAKLYAALVEDGREQLAQGEVSAGIARLAEALAVEPGGEAAQLLLRLTPTAMPEPVRAPTPPPVRATAAPTPRPAVEPIILPTATLRAPPVVAPPTATLRIPGT